MNAEIYNIMLEDSENIAGFFRDQLGGELCLALLLDISHTLAERGQVDALECVIETVYSICEMPKRWSCSEEDWSNIFWGMIKDVTQFCEGV